MKAYKLVRVMKDGSLAPLFINQKLRFPIGKWLKSEFHPRKGFAERQGWHCTFTPFAPHLSEKKRVWIEVEVTDFIKYDRPESQGGAWILADQMKVVRVLDKQEVADLLVKPEDKPKPKVTKSSFLEWYFSDSVDIKILGRNVLSLLEENNTATITTQDIFNSSGYIPSHICENDNDADEDYEPQDCILID